MNDQTETGPPHRWVADKLGMSLSGVSLLRSGKRQPSMETMEAVEREFSWELCDQVMERADYASALQTHLVEQFNKEQAAPIPGQIAIDDEGLL